MRAKNSESNVGKLNLLGLLVALQNYHLSLASLIIKPFNKSSHAKRIARREINMRTDQQGFSKRKAWVMEGETSCQNLHSGPIMAVIDRGAQSSFTKSFFNNR